MDLIEWIKAGIDRPGKSQRGLAEAMGRSGSKISTLLRATDGGANLKLRELAIIAEYLEEPIPPLAGSAFVPIIGEVAAEPFVGFVRTCAAKKLQKVAVPLGMSGALAALSVGERGMPSLAQEGWFVFCGARQNPSESAPKAEKLFRCGLPDGTSVVRFVKPSLYEGLFDLEWYGQPPLVAQRVEWVEPVLQIVTSDAARIGGDEP